MAGQAGRFVWLSIDIDKDANAAFVNRFPVPGVPTFMVVDGAGDKVVLTRAAGVDAPQLLQFLDEGERAFRGGGVGPDGAFEEGEKLAGAGKYKEAAAAFERALVAPEPGWPRRRAAVEALMEARASAGDHRGCLELAERETRGGVRDAFAANLVITGMWCADEGKLAPGAVEKRAREALALPDLGDDDRSSLYEVLVERDKSLAADWMAFVEKRAAAAPTAAARAAYDPHRLAAAIALGHPERAVAALQASERDLPDDYNGPARLAIAYLEMGRYDDAVAACERALQHAYGPRRLRVEETRANALKKKGDVEGARRVLQAAIKDAGALPKTERSTAAIARLKKLLGD